MTRDVIAVWTLIALGIIILIAVVEFIQRWWRGDDDYDRLLGLEKDAADHERRLEALETWARENFGAPEDVDTDVIPAVRDEPTAESHAVIERQHRELVAGPATTANAIAREAEIEAIRARSAERNARRPKATQEG